MYGYIIELRYIIQSTQGSITIGHRWALYECQGIFLADTPVVMIDRSFKTNWKLNTSTSVNWTDC